ncbi:MAG: GCN5-related N-acetyltransferase, partial [uncultured Acidimicrobiales bacterium]
DGPGPWGPRRRPASAAGDRGCVGCAVRGSGAAVGGGGRARPDPGAGEVPGRRDGVGLGRRGRPARGLCARPRGGRRRPPRAAVGRALGRTPGPGRRAPRGGHRVGGRPRVARRHPLDVPRRALERSLLRAVRVRGAARGGADAGAARPARPRSSRRSRRHPSGVHAPAAL